MKLWQLTDFFEAFGYQYDAEGVGEFFELVIRVAEFREDHLEAKSGAGAVLVAEAQKRGRYFRAYEQWMKARIRNIVDADPEALALWGVYPSKRTVSHLAWAISDVLYADLTISGLSSRAGEAQPVRAGGPEGAAKSARKSGPKGAAKPRYIRGRKQPKKEEKRRK